MEGLALIEFPNSKNKPNFKDELTQLKQEKGVKI